MRNRIALVLLITFGITGCGRNAASIEAEKKANADREATNAKIKETDAKIAAAKEKSDRIKAENAIADAKNAALEKHTKYISLIRFQASLATNNDEKLRILDTDKELRALPEVDRLRVIDICLKLHGGKRSEITADDVDFMRGREKFLLGKSL